MKCSLETLLALLGNSSFRREESLGLPLLLEEQGRGCLMLQASRRRGAEGGGDGVQMLLASCIASARVHDKCLWS